MLDEDYALALRLQDEINTIVVESSNDLYFARTLQAQFETEAAVEAPTIDLTYKKDNKKQKTDNSKSLVDPSWEVVDPTPDIHTLFIAFNQQFFSNKLEAVSISWSKRMTTCAGICSYHSRGGLCRITLSEPLLKLRPRKDLVETMLHEMIHAYLFVTRNNRDRDGHGPEFHKHMYRINAEAGTNITVYHDFHDEVNLYKQYIWRCDGPCQRWKPYFGIVKRATNRAPGPYDRWFGEHSRNCGGNFTKIQEPEKTMKPKSKTKAIEKPSPAKKSLPDIRNYFVNPSPDNKSDKSNPNISTIKKINSTSSKLPQIKSVIKNTNIHGFTSLNGGNCCSSNNEIEPSTSKNNFVPFSGKGQKLSTTPTKKMNPISSDVNQSPKRLKMNKVDCPVCKKLFEMDYLNQHLDSCLENQRDDIKCVLCFKNILKEEYDVHVLQCSEDQAAFSPQSQSSNKKECPECKILLHASNFDAHVAECLITSYGDLNKYSTVPNDEVIEVSDNESSNDCIDIVICLVCQKRVLKSELNIHLEECMDNLFDKTKELNDSMLVNTVESDSDDGESEKNYENIPEEAKAKFIPCPVCYKMYPCYVIHAHIESCLK